MSTLFFIGTGEALVLFVFFTAGLAPLVFAIIALVDLFKRDFDEKMTDKILLVLLIIFAPLLGSIIYYFFLRNNYPLKLQGT